MLVDITSLEHLNGVLGENSEVIIVLTQPSWCQPCRQLKPHLNKLADKGRVVAVVDLDTVPAAVVEFDVQGVPRLMLYQDGAYVKNITGRTVLQIEKELS